jgi:hypothetical protein
MSWAQVVESHRNSFGIFHMELTLKIVTEAKSMGLKHGDLAFGSGSSLGGSHTVP